jgi:hypothetical protein
MYLTRLCSSVHAVNERKTRPDHRFYPSHSNCHQRSLGISEAIRDLPRHYEPQHSASHTFTQGRKIALISSMKARRLHGREADGPHTGAARSALAYGKPLQEYGLSHTTKDTMVCELKDSMRVHFHLHIDQVDREEHDPDELLVSLTQAPSHTRCIHGIYTSSTA